MVSIEAREKDKYIEQLEKKAFLQGRLLYGQTDLTYHCNLRCQHCFIVREEDKQELTFDDCVDFDWVNYYMEFRTYSKNIFFDWGSSLDFNGSAYV